jgi:hypothetical protein
VVFLNTNFFFPSTPLKRFFENKFCPVDFEKSPVGDSSSSRDLSIGTLTLRRPYWKVSLSYTVVDDNWFNIFMSLYCSGMDFVKLIQKKKI